MLLAAYLESIRIATLLYRRNNLNLLAFFRLNYNYNYYFIIIIIITVVKWEVAEDTTTATRVVTEYRSEHVHRLSPMEEAGRDGTDMAMMA